MAQATMQVGFASDRGQTADHAAVHRPMFARGLIIAVALSLPLWAALIYCAARLL